MRRGIVELNSNNWPADFDFREVFVSIFKQNYSVYLSGRFDIGAPQITIECGKKKQTTRQSTKRKKVKQLKYYSFSLRTLRGVGQNCAGEQKLYVRP